jgi:hypothetical protein
MRLITLPRVIPVILLGTIGFAFGQPVAHHPVDSGLGQKPSAASSKANAPASHSPADAVIGVHLADWIKQAKQKDGAALAARKAAKANSAAVNILPPAFYAPPFLTLGDYTSSTLGNPVAADFNNDGKIDYANVRDDGQIEVLLNPGSFSNLAGLTSITNTSALSKSVGIAQVVVADMNGDGYADLVGADSNNSSIVEWLGNGDGTFKDAVYYTVAPGSGASWVQGLGAIAVADFNGDGKPDVATIEGTAYDFTNNKMTVTEQTFLNLGDGTLTPGQETDFVSVENIGPNFGAADVVSKDGKTASGVALVVGDYGYPNSALSGTYVWIFPSQGNGSFTAPTIPTTPLISTVGIPTITATNLTASFKSNASLKGAIHRQIKSSNNALSTGIATTDLVVVIGNGAIYDVPYTGSGTPTSAVILAGAPQELSGDTNQFPSAPGAFPLTTNNGGVVADFNGDGYQDLLTTTPATAYIFLNNGSAAFTSAPAEVAGTDTGHIVAADFDNNGYASFLWTAVSMPQVGYYQNLGISDATQAGLFYAAPTVSGPSTDGGTSHYAVGGAIRVQAVADVNGDGLQDVIATDGSYVYRDGFAAHSQGDIVLGINNGAANGENQKNGFTFTTVISGIDLQSLGSNAFLEPVTVKNSAGTTIMFATNTPASFFTMNIDSSGKAGSAQTLQFADTAPACSLYYADAGDVNGDGFNDIVVAYAGDYVCNGGSPGSGTVNSGFFTFLGDGSGNFQPGKFTSIGTALYKVKLVPLVTGSKTLSVVAVDSYTPHSFGPHGGGAGTYDVYVIPGKGDGTFDIGSAMDVAPSYIASDVILGDFNQDGKQDLTITTEGQYDTNSQTIIANTSGALLIQGNGDGTFGAVQLIDQGIYPASGAYADFNGDGKPDLALSQYTSVDSLYAPMLEIFPNLGGGVFGPSYSQLLAPFNYVLEGRDAEFGAPVFTGAFTKGGSADLLISHGYDSALYINLGPPTLQVTTNPATAEQGTTVTLTASLAQGSSLTSATGSVIFSVNGTTLGASALSSGTATLTTTDLPVGSDTIQASYSGDASPTAITGQVSVTINAVAPALTISASSSSLNLTAGATGTVVLNLTANQTFTGTVSFSCSGAPSESSCTVNPSSLGLGSNQTGNVAVVIATTAKNNQYQALTRSGWGAAAGGVSMAGLFCLLIPRKRRIARLIGIWILTISLWSSFLLLSGCGSSGNKYPGTPAGASQITVTATSGSVTATQVISLTVTQASGQ